MKDLPTAPRIAVFRALQLGDMLCAVPALRALRIGEPAARITLIGLPWAQDFVRRFSRYIDDFMPFPGAPGFPEQDIDPARLAAFYRAARQRRFDLSIQLHGSGEMSNAVAAALGARQVAGFVAAGACDVPSGKNFLRWPQHLSEVERYVSLMSHLGYCSASSELEFPLDAADAAELRSLYDKHGLRTGRYVCVHPGARMASRRWPVARFAAVANQLAARGWRIVLTGASAERDLAETFSQEVGTPFVDLCGQTSLGTLAALIARSRLLVCNDTGVSHIAAAVHAPSLVIACGSDVARWAPLDRALHTVVADHPPCRPCMHQACPIGHPCALAIEAADVARTALRLITEEATYAA
jgi:ADP-heptose:LPS heptosyltransferase